MQYPELAAILMRRSYRERRPPEEPFRLASGKTSWHYFECQRTTSYAPAMPLIARALWPLLDPSVVAVGGPTRGADPVADAVAFYSATEGGRPVNTFSVRKEPKDHGTGRWVEGSAQAGDRVAVVEDTVTTGGSLLRAVERCREAGLAIAQVLFLVDREEGGLQNVQAAVGPGVPVAAVYRYGELQEYRRALDDAR
jgi:orotate phosphoribosyltransferase